MVEGGCKKTTTTMVIIEGDSQIVQLKNTGLHMKLTAFFKELNYKDWTVDLKLFLACLLVCFVFWVLWEFVKLIHMKLDFRKTTTLAVTILCYTLLDVFLPVYFREQLHELSLGIDLKTGYGLGLLSLMLFGVMFILISVMFPVLKVLSFALNIVMGNTNRKKSNKLNF